MTIFVILRLVLISWVWSLYAGAQVGELRITIDQETFPKAELAIFQKTANDVVAQVDDLIPGVPKGYQQPSVIIFVESSAFLTSNQLSGPATFSGPKRKGEPTSTQAETVRIGVYGVEGLHVRRFAYQLAHELAHVKMGGAEVGNSLFETLAVAVSYEVLARLRMYDYLIPEMQTDIRRLPQLTQQQLADGSYEALRAYWQSTCALEWFRLDNRPCQTLGALLLRAANEPRWTELLDIGELTVSSPLPRSGSIELKPPNIPALKRAGFAVEVLGYRP